MIRYREVELKFSDIWRVFISGASSAGKTYFAYQLLKLNLFHFDTIYYFHPDFHETRPVDWKFKNIVFVPGLPSLDDLLAIAPNSCLIFDDLFEECSNDKNIDYLYRVLSTKRQLHCMIMTQRYYSQGRFARNIRNSSNYHVLMRNADENTNLRVAHTMKLKPEIEKANKLNENKMYPYIFIDCNNFSRITGIKVFIDILGKYKIVIMKSEAYCLMLLREFNSEFQKIENNLAIRNEASNQQGNRERCLEAETSEEKSTRESAEHFESPEQHLESAERQIKSREGEPQSAGHSNGRSSTSKSATSRRASSQQKRNQFERSVRKIIHRYKKRAVL